jgi:hypothetical protein
MRTPGAILAGFFLIVTLVASAFQWHDEYVETTVFDPTDNVRRP